MQKMEILSRPELINKVNAFLQSCPGENFHIVFKRETPKCVSCGKKRNWVKGLDTHCSCGGVIEYEKDCQYAKIQSLHLNRESFFYFEGGHSMRQCKFDNLISISYCTGNKDEVTLFLVKDAPRYALV